MRYIIEFSSRCKVEYEISDNGCFEVTNKTFDKQGYVHLRLNGERYLAHRLVYMTEVLKVTSLSASIVIRHKCDNTKCVNPDHLIHGSQIDNIQDMVGNSHEVVELKESDVELIRKWYHHGFKNQYELARIFNVGQYTISKIITGKTHKYA